MMNTKSYKILERFLRLDHTTDWKESGVYKHSSVHHELHRCEPKHCKQTMNSYWSLQDIVSFLNNHSLYAYTITRGFSFGHQQIVQLSSYKVIRYKLAT